MKKISSQKTTIPSDSLLVSYSFTHEDRFEISLDLTRYPQFCDVLVEEILANLLDGFIHAQSANVSALMRVRNVFALPFGLRTSRLACPVSSLLEKNQSNRFMEKFPVHAKRITTNFAEVLLGADDKHLTFRSSVAIQKSIDTINISLASRVNAHTFLGQCYMRAIYFVHTRYVEPTMLKCAVKFLLQNFSAAKTNANQDFASGTLKSKTRLNAN